MTQPSPADAKQRQPVLVTRPGCLPFVATLLHWPVDPEERRPRLKPENAEKPANGVQTTTERGTVSSRRRRSRSSAGAKAKVQLSSGAIISVARDHVRLA